MGTCLLYKCYLGRFVMERIAGRRWIHKMAKYIHTRHSVETSVIRGNYTYHCIIRVHTNLVHDDLAYSSLVNKQKA